MDVSFWRLWLAENRAPKRQGDAEQTRKGVASRFHGLEPNNYLTQKILWLEKTKTPTWIEDNIKFKRYYCFSLKKITRDILMPKLLAYFFSFTN